MKIAILTSGILPVPAVQGGAVENLVDIYLAYNDVHKLHDITVYSVSHPDVYSHPALRSDVNHYRFIDVSSFLAKVRKNLHKMAKGEEFYHYSIEYFFEKAMAHIQTQDYDMLIIENRPGYALKLAKNTSARLVYHLHNDFLNADIPHAQEIYTYASRIITISDYIASRVRTIEPHDQKCVTVHNGIDLETFSPTIVKKAAPSDYHLNPDDFVLVFSGRIIPEKGISQLIDAMLQLKDYEHIKLLVLGSSFYANADNDAADSFIRQLKEKSRALGSRLVFTGFVPYSEVPAVLSLADVAVVPSIWEEPFGLTCVEALAMGLPVITTRKGGIPEIVTDDCAVILPFDESLPERIASAVLDLYNDPDRRRAMSAKALHTAQHYSKELFARNIFQAISI